MRTRGRSVCIALTAEQHTEVGGYSCSNKRDDPDVYDRWARYFLNRNKTAMAIVMQTSRCQEAGSRKNSIPAMAMIAAPPARIAGTDESGPPLWKRRKNAIVPAPTQIPVRAE